MFLIFILSLSDTQIYIGRLVIMNLVNISNGKSLHVPYRDSKLTFLLQVKCYIFMKVTFWSKFCYYMNICWTIVVKGRQFQFFYWEFLIFCISQGFAMQQKVNHFLLFSFQDSLGGNAKTIIIANISPSNWLVECLFGCFCTCLWF